MCKHRFNECVYGGVVCTPDGDTGDVPCKGCNCFVSLRMMDECDVEDELRSKEYKRFVKAWFEYITDYDEDLLV